MSTSTPIVVALHGYEDDPDLLAAALAPLTDLGVTVVTPRGPVVASGGPAWFSSDGDGPVEAELRRSLEIIGEHVDRTAAEHANGRAAIVLGGYSQGGAAALAFALHDAGASQPLGGLFSISGYLLHAESIPYDPAGLAAGATPVLVVHADNDDVVAVQQGRSSARLLERHGAAVRFVQTDEGHTLGPVAVASLRDWLATSVIGRA